MTAFNQSWDFLKATVYRGTMTPRGLSSTITGRIMVAWYALDQPGSRRHQIGFLTTDAMRANIYAHEREDMMHRHPEYIYIIQYEADTIPIRCFISIK